MTDENDKPDDEKVDDKKVDDKKVDDKKVDDKDDKQNVVRVDFKRAQRTSPSDPLAPQKFAVFSRFIAKGKVMVTLDARRTGVNVPSHLANEPQLNLDFSERFGLSDFMYDERGVRASLSFNRQPFFCDVPWSSVYALFSHVDNERLTWARALPQEILAQLPEASVEHLERVLELQVERLLRNAREQRERELKPAPPLLDAPALGVLDDVPDAPADGAVATDKGDKGDKGDKSAAKDPGENGGDDDKPDNKPPRGPGGLRLVKG